MKTLNKIFLVYAFLIIALATVNITAIWWLIVPVAVGYTGVKIIEKNVK